MIGCPGVYLIGRRSARRVVQAERDGGRAILRRDVVEAFDVMRVAVSVGVTDDLSRYG